MAERKVREEEVGEVDVGETGRVIDKVDEEQVLRRARAGPGEAGDEEGGKTAGQETDRKRGKPNP